MTARASPGGRPIAARSNSGIFFHTAFETNGLLVRGYETQVNNSFARDPVRTGSLYNVVKVFEASAKDPHAARRLAIVTSS